MTTVPDFPVLTGELTPTITLPSGEGGVKRIDFVIKKMALEINLLLGSCYEYICLDTKRKRFVVLDFVESM